LQIERAKIALADEQVAERRAANIDLAPRMPRARRGAAVESCNTRQTASAVARRATEREWTCAQVAELRGANERLKAEVCGANKRTKVLARSLVPDAAYNANHGGQITPIMACE
jgi:hypothetical protein